MNNRTRSRSPPRSPCSPPCVAAAQDYGAMIQQQMAAMNANIARGQQMVNGMVRQRMADPQVQAGYQQYLAQMRRGSSAHADHPTHTCQLDLYRRLLGPGHRPCARATRPASRARAGSRCRSCAPPRRSGGRRSRCSATATSPTSRRPAGGLLGQSTYLAPNGAALALPHTGRPTRSTATRARPTASTRAATTTYSAATAGGTCCRRGGTPAPSTPTQPGDPWQDAPLRRRAAPPRPC